MPWVCARVSMGHSSRGDKGQEHKKSRGACREQGLYLKDHGLPSKSECELETPRSQSLLRLQGDPGAGGQAPRVDRCLHRRAGALHAAPVSVCLPLRWWPWPGAAPSWVPLTALSRTTPAGCGPDY